MPSALIPVKNFALQSIDAIVRRDLSPAGRVGAPFGEIYRLQGRCASFEGIYRLQGRCASFEGIYRLQAGSYRKSER